MTKLNADSGAIFTTVIVGPAPSHFCFDGTHLWVANQGDNNVTRLDRNGAVIGTYTVETAPPGIVFDGRAIWVTNSGSNTVSQLDCTTGQLLGAYPVGNRPAGICFDGSAMWVPAPEPTVSPAISPRPLEEERPTSCVDTAAVGSPP